MGNSAAGGMIWKEGRAEIPLGEAPKEREMPTERESEHAELSGKSKGRESLMSIHSFGQITQYPTKGLCISFPKPGEHKQRDEEVEFLFTLADRNLNLSSPLRTKDLKPLMS